MRLRYLILLGVVAFAGCEVVGAFFGILNGESKAVDHALDSPNEQIQAEGAEARRDHPALW